LSSEVPQFDKQIVGEEPEEVCHLLKIAEAAIYLWHSLFSIHSSAGIFF